MLACSVTRKRSEKDMQHIRQAFKDLKNIMVRRQGNKFCLPKSSSFHNLSDSNKKEKKIMLDIYRLFYFVEETGLLIQEKWYKATHPQIWERNLRKYRQEEQEHADEDISGDISGESNPEQPKERPETGNTQVKSEDSGSEYPGGDKKYGDYLCPALFRCDSIGKSAVNGEDGKRQENQ